MAGVEMMMPEEGDEVAILETSQGRIVLQFFPHVAPNHVARFKECCNDGVYSGTYFHRLIPGFMIQGGDPNTKTGEGHPGTGGHGGFLNAEFNDIKHVPGILSAARTNNPNSAQSQFFLMHGTSPHLDQQYTVYGRIFEGLEILDKIVNLPMDHSYHPTDQEAARITTSTIATWPV